MIWPKVSLGSRSGALILFLRLQNEGSLGRNTLSAFATKMVSVPKWIKGWLFSGIFVLPSEAFRMPLKMLHGCIGLARVFGKANVGRCFSKNVRPVSGEIGLGRNLNRIRRN